MMIRRTLRTFEKACLRPLARRLKGLFGGRMFGQGHDRVARLERRVEELESLVRELTGLAYLGLAEEPDEVDERTAA